MYRDIDIQSSVSPLVSYAFRNGVRNVRYHAVDASSAVASMALEPTLRNASLLRASAEGMSESLAEAGMSECERLYSQYLTESVLGAFEQADRLYRDFEDGGYLPHQHHLLYRNIAMVSEVVTRALAEASALCREFPI